MKAARKLDPRLEAIWNKAITSTDGDGFHDADNVTDPQDQGVATSSDQIVTASEEDSSQVRGGENPDRDGCDDSERGYAQTLVLRQLLDDTEAMFRRFVVLPDDRMFAGLALWVALTHVLGESFYAPRLLIRAAVNNSGKSTVAAILDRLCFNSWYLIGYTPAVLKNAGTGRTILLDEADNVDTKGADGGALRQIFNAWREGDTMAKMDEKGKDAIERDVFTMLCVIGNGTFPSTLTSRALVISMKPATAREAKRLEEWDSEFHDAEAHALRERFEQFAADLEPGSVRSLSVDVPANGREKQKWRTLFRLAEYAGGRWPELVRDAHTAFSERVADDRAHSNEATLLLRDLRTVFAYTLGPEDAGITTAEILRALKDPSIQDDDWPQLTTSTGEIFYPPLIDTRWKAEDLDANRLGWLLRSSVEVTAKRRRTLSPRPKGSSKDQRGYLLEDLLDSFERLVF